MNMSSLSLGLVGGLVDVPFDPALFVAPGAMTWNVAEDNVKQFQCAVVGNMMVVTWDIHGTSIGGTPGPLLYLVIPHGWWPQVRPLAAWASAYWRTDNGAQGLSIASVDSAYNNIHLYAHPDTSVPWQASSGNTRVLGSIAFPVKPQ